MEHLGPALCVAFKDIREKAQDFVNNVDLFTNKLEVLSPTSKEARYLIPFTQVEAQFKIQILNKDDNKDLIRKHFKKEDRQPWMKDYASTSRHLWRGQWFFEFIGHMLKVIVHHRNEKLSKLAQKTYTKFLAPHHNFFLVKIATAAILTVRSREKFISSISAEQSKV